MIYSGFKIDKKEYFKNFTYLPVQEQKYWPTLHYSMNQLYTYVGLYRYIINDFIIYA